MKFAFFTLCEAANSREGLLNVLSAGITRLTPAGYPAAMATLSAGALVVLERDEAEGQRTLKIGIRPRGDENPLFEAETDVTVAAAKMEEPALPMQIAVAVPLLMAVIPMPGLYELTAEFGDLKDSWPFICYPVDVPPDVTG